MEGVGCLLEIAKLLLEFPNMSFLSLAESSLAIGRWKSPVSLDMYHTDVSWLDYLVTYAALFCAFRLLWAGVTVSFSSLLLRPDFRSADWSSPVSVAVCGAPSLLKSLLPTECLVKDSGGECGGAISVAGSKRKVGSKEL